MSPFVLDPFRLELKASTFEVTPRRKRITVFKVGKVWMFKQYLDNKETFRALSEFYNNDKFRFEFKTIAERNKALKILDLSGFDYTLVEDVKPFVVKLSRYSKYAAILKNSVSHMETPDWRIFLMRDLAAVEEAARLGAEMFQGDWNKLIFR